MPVNSRRILIIDDDLDILANLSDILTDVGFETVTASSGPNALEKIAANCTQNNCGFDLCLLDFRMPGMDGVELLKKIHAIYPTIRAIMITAFAGDDGVKRALDAGTWKVMRKPIDVRTLLGMIDEAVAS